MRHERTSLLAREAGDIEHLTNGGGAPHTVFAHGLAGSIATTRPFGSGVHGSRTFLHFRGHGASSAPEGDWTYAALAAELRDVADHVAATRAVGVSMGAGALTRLVADTPQRFERIVMVLPAVVDTPRTDRALQRLTDAAALVDGRDLDGLTELFLDEQPVGVRDDPAVVSWAAQQARLLVGTPVSRALRHLPQAVPLTRGSELASVTVPALVLAQEEDPVHPVHVAEALAAALPSSRLVVLPPGGIMWTHRARVRALVSDFLNC